MPTLDDTPYYSTLLGEGVQPPPRGVARFYKERHGGMFWPHTPTTPQNIIANAKTLQFQSGAEIRVRILNFVHTDGRRYGHYELEVLDGQDEILKGLGTPQF